MTTRAEELTALIERHAPLCTAASDRIWEHAEPYFAEHASAAILRDLLREAGFQIEDRAAGLDTAFVATFGQGGPVIGLLGEYDALPNLSQQADLARQEPIKPGGFGHGCGHNLLGAGCAAASLAVKDYLTAHRLPGTIKFYGCPAEEFGGGKAVMADAGLFDCADALLTWHPSHAHYVQSAATLALKIVEFDFTGRSAHAAKSPHTGRSALDAVELTNVGANYLREHLPPDSRIHYAITNSGGSAPNVVPSEASVCYQLRAPSVATVRHILDRVCRVAEGAALMTGTTLQIREGAFYYDVIPNVSLEQVLQKNLEEFGLPVASASEESFAREIVATLSDGERSQCEVPEIRGQHLASTIPPHRPGMPLHFASTDVGNASWIAPTVQYRSAVWAVGTQPHTWQVVAQGRSSFAHKGMLHAARVLAGSALDLMASPDLLRQARTEFQEARQLRETLA